MILPRVKSYEGRNDKFVLPFEMRISADSIYHKKLSVIAEYFFPKSKILFTDDNCHIIIKNDNKRDEDYHLEITESGIIVQCGSYIGIRNAFATLSMMAVADQTGYCVDAAVIEDFPASSYRGVMIDLARGAKSFDKLIEDIVILGRLKINYLHLHLFDSKGSCVKIDSLPEICCIENYYSKEQMRFVAELAEALGMEIIPEWDMPGHSSKLFEGCDGMECDIPEDVERFTWAACAGTEKTYEVYEKIIEEIIDLFPGKYFHIGGDELHFAKEEEREIGYICHWAECSKCRQKMKEEGHRDIQDLYYYFILKIYDIVKKNGRTMIMWSDWLDCNRERVLPTDIIMQFWRVAGEGRGPIENCSMNNQLKMGYKVINSHYEEVYIDLEEYMNADGISDWRWDERPHSDEELKKNIIGSEACAWEYGNEEEYPHYDRTFAPSAAIFADKLWNGDKLIFDENYEEALTRAVFGISIPKELNVFKCIGGIMPPRTVNIKEDSFTQSSEKKIAYFDKIKCQKTDIEDQLCRLQKLTNIDSYCDIRINTYIEYLKEILAQM